MHSRQSGQCSCARHRTSSTIRPRSILPRWSLTPSCNAYSPSWWWPSATHSSAWTENQLIGSCGSMPSWRWSRIAVLRWASWSQQPCPVWTWPCRLRPGWWCHSCCWLASSSRWMGGSSKIPDDLRDERCMNTCALFGKKNNQKLVSILCLLLYASSHICKTCVGRTTSVAPVKTRRAGEPGESQCPDRWRIYRSPSMPWAISW